MPPKRRKKYLLIYITVPVLLFCSIHSACAQAAPMFQVIHLPRKTGYSKDKLNAELAALKDKEAVRKLLRAKNFPAATAIVLYINRPASQSAYWTINTSLATDKEDSRIILQSRDNTTTRFYKLSEFKNFFKDTLALIDTLAIELFIRDNDYPSDQYTLASACGKKIQKKKIAFSYGKLIFTKALVSDCKEGLPPVTIYNDTTPHRMLASCKLNFLTADDQELLLAMVAFIKAQEPEKDIKDIALHLYNYSLHHFGRFYFPQLLHWLDKNNAAPNDGHS